LSTVGQVLLGSFIGLHWRNSFVSHQKFH